MKDYRDKPGVVDEQGDDNVAICPYCGTATGDVDEWVTQSEEEAVCFSCERKFMVVAEYSRTVYTFPIKTSVSVKTPFFQGGDDD